MRTRRAARLLVHNTANEILLLRYTFRDGFLEGDQYWATPGGELKDGENHLQAAQRELREETGLTDSIGDFVGQRVSEFTLPDGERVKAVEKYYSVFAKRNVIDLLATDPYEAQYVDQYNWWKLSEIESTAETIYPENLVELVKRFI